nr:hypothetical protein SrhCFBP13529_20065 [Stenotrophomonas rhizophila]
MAAHGRPVPIKASERRLLVSESELPLAKPVLETAWQRMIKRSIAESVITNAQRFALYGLMQGVITYSDEKPVGGHRTEATRQLYDRDIPVVNPAIRTSPI